MIGAAFAAAAPSVPSWSTGFQNGSNMGGLIAAVLAPAGGFGKFLCLWRCQLRPLVLLQSILLVSSAYSRVATKQFLFYFLIFNHHFRKFVVVLCLLSYFSLIGNCFMAITPFFARVPRYVFTVMSTAM